MSPPEGVQLRLPEIDFRGLDPSNAVGGILWDSVRAQVMKALESYGCFQAIYDGVSPEMKDELLGKAAPELFALPVETKMQCGCVGGRVSSMPYRGYIRPPNLPYESLNIDDPARLESVDEFARCMWPLDGNITFRNAVWMYAKHVQALEQIVHRMILQSFGVEKYYESQIESMLYVLRMTESEVPKDQENNIVLGSHVDINMITIVCEDQVGGLEVQTKDEEWIHVPSAMQNCFNVMIGEAFRAWSNGRLRPPFHRVRITEDNSKYVQLKRYSLVFASQPKEGAKVEVPKELIDDAHPLSFKPFNYEEYLRFRFSDEQMNKAEEDALKAFCGVEA